MAEETSSNGSGSGTPSIGSQIWEFLSKSDKWFSGVNLYDVIHDDRPTFNLSNINFLPLYVKKHIANDFYTKMFSQLYPDPPTSETGSSSKGGIVDTISNAFSNAAGSAVSKVTNVVANQITSTANYARNLVSTLTFGLVDTSKSTTVGKNCSYDMIQTSIPHLKVTEIRLNDKLTQKGILFSCMSKMFNSAKDIAFSGMGMDKIVEKVSNGFDKGLDAVCTKLLGSDAGTWLKNMQSTEINDVLATRIGGLAYSFIRNAASGQYMYTYELPHFGTPTMMKSVSTSGFDHDGGSGDLLKLANEMIGGNLTFTENIVWSAADAKGSFTMGPFEGTFYLFNDTLEMYKQNLDFILHAVTHSMPIRDSFMYRPPCCYDVTDVGNRRCYFCSGEFTVKKVGKIRKLSAYPGMNVSMLTNLLDEIKQYIMTSDTGMAKSVNDDFIDYIPDAFEIHYTFTPLISENYNTFVYYFLNEEYVTKVAPTTEYGDEINLVGDELMKTFVTEFTSALA